MEFCYPTLDGAYWTIYNERRKEESEARESPECAAEIRAAVDAERKRVQQKRVDAQTERGREIATTTGAAASLVDRRVREVATGILKRTSDKGTKH